ncbi:ABC transporter permease [Desulforhopalus sp. IMCC35007]|uniref:ABC transporter permease n=1 Tax=Desulforhopalus sp. IMCC35007 TaxID=2569543 RepID=UPI0010ADE9FC|nr:ABC transporter permease [Desulforhopalus sp. IMCC35007]TKB07489.1 ABC transporter permease [Desulforhopalus sp. IMCC35007]
MKIRRLAAVARKETLHLLRDWRSLTLALAIPLFLILLYGYALTLDLRQVPTVVWDQSRTPQSRELLSMFHSSPYFSVKGYRNNYNELQDELDRGAAMVALVVPGDFAEKVSAAKPVKIQIIGDGSDANTSRLAMNYAATIGTIYAGKITSEQMQRKGRGKLEQPITLEQRSWYNPGLRSQNVLIPGIIALVMIVVAALLTSTTVAKEWEMGTMEQLISTPLRGPELIFGKVIPYFCIGMIDVTAAVLMGQWIFDVPIVGNAGLLFAMSSVFLTGALFFGMTLSIKLKTQVLANQLAIIAGFLPTLLLSGFVFAIENMPMPLQFLTYIVPARYFIAILRGIYLKGIGLEILWLDALFLAVYALIMMLAANRKFVFKLE